MKYLALRIVTCLAIAFLATTTALGQDLCDALSGAVIIAQDPQHTYLGSISSQYDGDSIFNEYGPHGSEYSSESIWNEYSQFGGEYSSYSPFNEYTSEPPMIIKDHEVIAYLTVNQNMNGAVSPYLLKARCQ
jgi:hypothetical protein